MPENTAIPQIPLAPASIQVQGPDRGRYNLLSNDESARYVVRVDGVIVSTTMSIEDSEQIEGYYWPDLILAIIEQAEKWISGSDIMARRKAVAEWIRRDDPEDERLDAIEAAECEFHARRLAQKMIAAPTSWRARALEIIAAHDVAEAEKLLKQRELRAAIAAEGKAAVGR